MKKTVIFVMLLSSIILMSCGKAEKPKEDKPIKLTFAIQDIPNNPSYKGYLAFIQKLKELSGNTMNVELIQLTKYGSLTEMFYMAARDQFDIVAIAYTDMADVIPELAIINAPYVAKDYDHYLRMNQSPYGEMIDGKIDALGVELSSLWYMGSRHITSNKPIHSSADLKGLRFRTPPSSNLIVFADTLEAIPNSIGFQQLHDALESGEVHAQENPLSIIESLKLYEVQKYIAITDHVMTIIPIFINKDIYDGWTSQQQNWYDEAMEHGRKFTQELVNNEEEQFLQKLINERGMLVTYPDKEEFRQAMQVYYDKLEAQFGEGSVSTLMAIE